MFHFLSDLTTPAGSAAAQNVQESANPPQQIAVKRKRGRPKKIVEDGNKSLDSSQDGNSVMVKCEPAEVAPLRNRRTKNQGVDEIGNGSLNSGIANENSLSRDGVADSHNDGEAIVAKGRQGRRNAAEDASGTSANSEGGDEGRGRRASRQNYNRADDGVTADNESDESDNEVLMKKVVKQKKPAATKKSSTKIPGVEEITVDPTKVVKCACCEEEMTFKDFTKHNLTKHNNLGWIVGDPPVDLFNEKSLMTILKRVLKHTKKKFLVCDSCGVEKKSCLGYITHKRVCGKTVEEQINMKVTCELCGRKVMPVSVKAHMASHAKPKLDGVILEYGRKRAAASKAKSRLSEFNYEDGLVRPVLSTGKKKLYSCPKPRRAAGKIIAKWRSELLSNNPAKCYNAECPFETDNVETMKEHFKVCEFAAETSNTYDCLVCSFKFDDEAEVRAHVAEAHPEGSEGNAVEINESGGSDVGPSEADDPLSEEFESDDDESRQRIRVRSFMMKSKRPCHRFRFLAKEELTRSTTLETFSPTLMWSLQYRIENDSPSLFHGFMSTEEDWHLVPDSEVEQYLPATKNSVHVAFGDPENGVRFSLFDSTVVEDSSAVFAGGPVWALAWCPLPLDLAVKYNLEVSQFLAISCHREMDQFHGIYSCYTGPNVIQLWDVGSLNNTDSPVVPRLALAIVHEFGTVWRMEWCPSGAYGTSANGKLTRLGLLAAACSDGFVHVFSVCMPTELNAHIKPNQAPIYKCKPVLTLKPNSPELSQCFRLSWHRVKGHALMAGGYCDGKVALWNLENYSSLLYNKEDREMYPFHTFQAHYSVISALSLSPEGQYIMTGSRDCSVKFWNVEDTSAPITVTRKGLVTDGTWLSHWMCAMTTYDDAYLHEHSNATLIPIREFGFKPYPVLPQNSAAWCLSENSWMNSLVQGTLAGEVALNIAGQLFLGLDNEKFPTKKRLLICCTELRDLVRDAEGKEILGPESSKPSQVKEGGKSNGKAKDKNDKVKKKGGKGKDKNSANSQEMVTDENIEEIPVENLEDSTPVELKPRDYKDTTEKYGINIKNFLDFKIHNIPPEVNQPMRQSNAMGQVHSEMFPIASVNQVQWNPNLKSCLWLAVGHHCGLVRLVCLKYLNTRSLSKFYNKAETILDREHPSCD